METTAVPELRVQARDLAASLCRSLGSPPTANFAPADLSVAVPSHLFACEI